MESVVGFVALAAGLIIGLGAAGARHLASALRSNHSLVRVDVRSE